ncbi:MAG: class I SAM-dependent methyltransferase [Dehalococcoidia bacterium]
MTTQAREVRDTPSSIQAPAPNRAADNQRNRSRLTALLGGGRASRPNRLPDRYHERWRDAFDIRVQPSLVAGVRILDVGSGRTPTIPPDQRPEGCWYAGLDLSIAELQRAPEGSYNEMHVADVAHRVPELEGRFDLIVSWQVLEHVKPLDAALENLQSYLRSGGRLVAQFSGRYSAFGLINMVVPQELGVRLMQQLLGRDPDTVFPAYYNRCWHQALQPLSSAWSSWRILPRYRGGRYFQFSSMLQRIYISYEEWVIRGHRHNLATHYIIVGEK